MKCVLRVLTVVVLCALGPLGGAAAQGVALARADAERFTAVGRLDIANSRFCTATLISPTHLLTAAHCLYDPRTHVRVPDRALSFVAGLHGRSHAARRRVVRTAVLPEFRYDGVVSYDRVKHDIAILELDSPIEGAVVRPMAVGPGAGAGDGMALVSYSRGRPDVPSFQGEGRVVGRRGTVMAMSFAVSHGASGSPVIVTQGGRSRIVGVVSASATSRQRAVALTVLTGDTVGRLVQMLPDATRMARLPGDGGS